MKSYQERWCGFYSKSQRLNADKRRVGIDIKISNVLWTSSDLGFLQDEEALSVSLSVLSSLFISAGAQLNCSEEDRRSLGRRRES